MIEKQEVSLFSITEIDIVYKNKQPNGEMPVISTSRDAAGILRSVWDENKIELLEQFKVILLNHANKCLGVFSLSQGGISDVVADPRLIFMTALKAAATKIILAHNHPAGKLNPSNADLLLTRRIHSGGEILLIDVLDHIILSSEGYYSMADEGMMPL